MEQIPTIKSVAVIGHLKLTVRFENGIEKEYDCAPLLARPSFHLLNDPGFFRAVKVDSGGYGISWGDDIDLSEYELWTNGIPVESLLMNAQVKFPLERIIDLCRRYQVTELSIFGSALREDFRSDSDIDFLVVFENGDTGPWMGKLTGLQEDLAALLGRPVDLVLKENLKWVIRDEVLRDAKVIYEAA